MKPWVSRPRYGRALHGARISSDNGTSRGAGRGLRGKIGLGPESSVVPGGCCAAVKEGGTRVEPHVEDVVALCVVAAACSPIRTKHVFHRQLRHASTPLARRCRRTVDQRERVGVQLAGFLGRGTAVARPSCAVGRCPIGRLRSCRAARLAVSGRSSSLRSQRARSGARSWRAFPAQRHLRRPHRVVHADEPSAASAVDHRRLVAPAMRVAVNQVRRREQPAGVTQAVGHQGRAFQMFCHRTAARPRRTAVALHGFICRRRPAVRAAGLKSSIRSRRRVHDARAFVGVAYSAAYRREALVAASTCRAVVEVQPFECAPSVVAITVPRCHNRARPSRPARWPATARRAVSTARIRSRGRR